MKTYSQTWFCILYATALGAALALTAPVALCAKSSRAPVVPTPTFAPSRGVFTNVQDVTVSCTITGATIRYTVNGKTPTTNDLEMVPGEAIRVAGKIKLKVRAWVNGMTPSRIKKTKIRTPLTWPYTTPTSLFTAPSTNHSVFRTGQTITVSNSNFTAYEIYNLRNQQVAFVSSGVPTNLVNLPAGHYFIQSKNDVRAFAVVSPACVGASFTGAETTPGVNNYSWEIYDAFKPQMWRGLFTGWKRCEPSDGVYTWTNSDRRRSLDDQIDAALEAGATKVIIPAAQRPDWMLGKTNDAVFISKYTAFCAALAEHLKDKYDGRVGLGIEIWNEPHYTTTESEQLPYLDDCEPATVMTCYLNVLTNAYKAIKAVSPNIEVVAAGFTAPPMDLLYTNFVAMGGLNYMDSLGVTYKRWTAYESSAVIPDSCFCCGTSVDYTWVEDDFDTLCRKWIAAIQGKPLYMYEAALLGHSSLGIPYYYYGIGAKADNGITWQQGYSRAQKQVIMGRAAGVSMILNHVWEGFSSGESTRPTTFSWEFAGWEYVPKQVPGGRGPHPKTSAWLAAVAQVNGGTNFTNVHDSTRWVYAWSNPTNTTVAAWKNEGSAAVPVSFAVTDVFGNALPSEVGEEPVYWTTTTATPYDAAIAGFVAIGGTP